MTVDAVAVGNVTTAPLDTLAPIRATLRAVAASPHGQSLHGITPNLRAENSPNWVRASELVSGDAIDDFLDTAKQRWRATAHAAAALAWKCYSYWVALPAVLGYASVRRVALVRPEAVLLRWTAHRPFLVVALDNPGVAVLPSDPLAALSPAQQRTFGVRVVPDEQALLNELRTALIDDHLAPLLDNVRRGLHISSRTFWGSLASGVAHGLSRAAEVVPGPTLETADQVLDALGIRDLVELAPREGGAPGLRVHRKTCCLAFTTPEPKICSGCCIR